MERNAYFNRLADLVALAEAGHFTLPDEVVDAHRLAHRLTVEVSQPHTDRVHQARERLVAAFTQAAANGAPWPDGHDVLEAEAADRADKEAFNALERAATAAQANFAGLVSDVADDLIATSLRPAVDRVLEETTQAAKALGAYAAAGNVEQLLTAPKAARAAWIALDALAGRYGVLRKARGVLVRAILNGGQQQVDDTNLFAEIRNLPDLWPTWRQRTQPPWPDGGRERMLWLAGPDVEVWMPTVAEQDARYREVFAEGLDRAAQARAVAAGGQAVLS